MHVISERPISSKKTNVPTFVVVVILKGNLHYISSGLVFFNKFEILNTSRLMGRKSNRGDICICMADSLCYTAETNTHTAALSLTQIFSLPLSWLWRRQWHPTPALLPGQSHGQRSLVGCSLWGRKVSDLTVRAHTFLGWREKSFAFDRLLRTWPSSLFRPGRGKQGSPQGGGEQEAAPQEGLPSVPPHQGQLVTFLLPSAFLSPAFRSLHSLVLTSLPAWHFIWVQEMHPWNGTL